MTETNHSEDTEPGTWFWLSFADANKPEGEQFLGVIVLKAYSFPDAIRTSHALGLNPGGEVMGIDFPSLTPAMYEVLKPYTGKLLTAEECHEVDAKLTPLMDALETLDSDVSVQCSSCNDAACPEDV